MNDTPPSGKQRALEKLSRIPIKIEKTIHALPKPSWIRIVLKASDKVAALKSTLRANHLKTVCEEATCPNLYECFTQGTATFMIMGDKCTRRCSFCDVAHGRPDPLDADEPMNLAKTVQQMGLNYVVITSVDRDDLPDGGALHFVNCIKSIRALSPTTTIEILVPDFRGRRTKAIEVLSTERANIFNHNIETIPRLYKEARPGSHYQESLLLLKEYQALTGTVTKSGIMLGLGEEDAEVIAVLQDLRAHNVTMVTIGQYLQPSPYHLAVKRYVTPDDFAKLGKLAKGLGFTHVASGPLVRSSYHADKQAAGENVG